MAGRGRRPRRAGRPRPGPVALADGLRARPPLAAGAHGLPRPRRRPGKRAEAGRGAAGVQPHQLHRLAAGAGRPAALHPLPRLRPLRQPVGLPPPAALGARHPHRRQRRPARHPQVAACRVRRPGRGRTGLHLRRGGADAHRLPAAVPPRLRANPQAIAGAHRSGLPRSSLGQHFQLRRWQILLEAAEAHPVSRRGVVRRPAAGDQQCRGGAPGDPAALRRLGAGAQR